MKKSVNILSLLVILLMAFNTMFPAISLADGEDLVPFLSGNTSTEDVFDDLVKNDISAEDILGNLVETDTSTEDALENLVKSDISAEDILEDLVIHDITLTSDQDTENDQQNQNLAPLMLMQNAAPTLAAEAVKASITADLNSEEDLFNTTDPIPFDSHYFKIHIDYDVEAFGTVQDGTTLKIELRPEEGQPNYLRYPYDFSLNKEVKDQDGGLLASLDINRALSLTLTFKKINNNFKASLDSPLEFADAINKYFESHPEQTTVDQTYTLYVNGQEQEKKVTFTLSKPEVPEVEVKFTKTNGLYKKNGTLGEGSMLYNIWVDSKLNKSNEFFIYDTPDVNLRFEDQAFKAYFGAQSGKLTKHFFTASTGKYVDSENGMEAELFDIYFLTDPSAKPSAPRQASYEDKTLWLDRYNVITGKQGMDSLEKAAVPKDILVEKPFGQSLTPEEKQKIEDAGGLNKTVGKGFKFHIKNFQSPYHPKGGFLVLTFYVQIANPSPTLDKDFNPVYYNTASYYAQEIPTCDPNKDDTCVPIECEKTKLEDVVSGKYSTEAIVKDYSIGATVDDYTLVDITKQDDKGTNLAGATFTIFESDANGNKGQVASNKEGVKLQKLISNAEGKLSLKQEDGSLTPVSLHLMRGYYIITEDAAPEGYQKANDQTFTVGLKVDPIIIRNVTTNNPDPTTKPTDEKPTTEPTDENPTTEPTDENPTDPKPTDEKPTEPHPTETKPVEPTAPKPGEPTRPSQPSEDTTIPDPEPSQVLPTLPTRETQPGLVGPGSDRPHVTPPTVRPGESSPQAGFVGPTVAYGKSVDGATLSAPSSGQIMNLPATGSVHTTSVLLMGLGLAIAGLLLKKRG